LIGSTAELHGVIFETAQMKPRVMTERMWSAVAATAIMLVAALACSGVAAAEPGTLDGDPLNVYVDGIGGVQFRYDGVALGAISPPLAGPEAARGGLEVRYDGAVYRLHDTATRRPVGTPTVSQGSSPDEQVLTSKYQMVVSTSDPTPFLDVVERIAYRAGGETAVVSYTFTSLRAGGPTAITAGVLGDLAINHDEGGSGIFFPTSAGANAIGATSGLVLTAFFKGVTDFDWSSWQQGDADQVFAAFGLGGLDRSVQLGPVADVGMGVSWDLDASPASPPTRSVTWSVGRPDPDPGPATAAVVVDPDVPTPVADVEVAAKAVRGRVLVKRPGARRFVVLARARTIPFGTIVAARRGVVKITAAANRYGGTQSARFFGGIFRVGQREASGGRLITLLKLVGALPVCSVAGRAVARPAAARRPTRRLWGDGHGRFRTRGRYSAATVRGTRWLVADTCAGTLTKVARGVVAVRDVVRKRTTLVRAGRALLVRGRR
jgi:hypothetical protein